MASNMTNMMPIFKNMAIALFVAYRAMLNNETPVACILVSRKRNEILSIGYNDTNRSLNGTRHAEFISIDKVISKYIPPQERSDLSKIQAFFADIVLYVTVEPCIMCASALKQIGVSYVVYGCGNERFGGNGTILNIHRDGINKSYPSYGGILRTEAIQLLRNFYIQENGSAPNPKIKKNKELENKEYPPNLDFKKYLAPEDFAEFYGHERYKKQYDNTSIEISPSIDHGYTMSDLINLEDLINVEELGEMYPDGQFRDAVENDLNTFYGLFYDINNEGRVDFSKSIIKIDQIDNTSVPLIDNECKKRKLNGPELNGMHAL